MTTYQYIISDVYAYGQSVMISPIDKQSPVPKYYQVYSTLHDLIKTGDIAPGTALPPTSVLIERFGVSRITLTKAMDMLDAEGVIERHQGKGTFACDITPQIPIVIGLFNDLSLDSGRYDRHFLWQAIMDGVQQVTSENDYALNLIGPQSDTGSSNFLEQVNGLIFHPGSEIKEERLAFLQSAAHQDFPVVCVDRFYEGLAIDCALFNNEETGFILTQALINKGHHRIAFVLSNEPYVSSVRNRLKGHRRALKDAGITLDDNLVLDLYCHTAAETHQTLLQQIEQHEFTAVVIANDPTTEKLLFDLIRLNHDRLKAISIQSGQPQPETEIRLDIAMIGDVISPYYRHYISIIAQHSGHKLGKAAAQLLIGRIKGEITGPPQTVIVPMDIVELN